MIDLQRYEGSTEGPWAAEFRDPSWVLVPKRERRSDWDIMRIDTGFAPELANERLIEDAPLLLAAYREQLAEVERLRAEVSSLTMEMENMEVENGERDWP